MGMTMKRLVFALALVMALAAPALAVTTAKFTLTNAAWTDLGAGPLLLTFKGSGVFAVGDATPSIPKSEGFTMISGDSFYINSTSHVWGMAQGAPSVTAYVSAY
jgi:hypothetical protein